MPGIITSFWDFFFVVIRKYSQVTTWAGGCHVPVFLLLYGVGTQSLHHVLSGITDALFSVKLGCKIFQLMLCSLWFRKPCIARIVDSRVGKALKSCPPKWSVWYIKSFYYVLLKCTWRLFLNILCSGRSFQGAYLPWGGSKWALGVS